MSRFTFTPGEHFRLSDELYHLRRKLDGDKWQIEKDANGEYRAMDEKELLELYFQNLLSFVSHYMENQVEESVVENKIARTFADYPENLQQEAKRRRKYIQSIEGKTGEDAIDVLRKVSMELGDAGSPHISTVLRWAKKFNNSRKDICSLVPYYSGRGNRKPRYPDEVVQIAVNEVRKIYLNSNRNSIDETLAAVRHAIECENLRLPEHEKLPKPKRKFLRNIIEAMDAYEVESARHGKNAAKIRFREANTSGEIIMEPLERVEMDHTPLDLIVVDAESHLPLGRPTLTIALDRCTRCICGYHVGYDPASYVSIEKCLSNTIKPKEYVKKKYPDIVNSWPCWGIPDLVVVDNGPEFHSKDLEDAALSVLTDIRYCPARQPWLKGAVERFFRTIGKSLIHTVPGTTFSNIMEKGDYNSLKMAVVSEADLNELLHMWICDVYHQTVHRQTLRTPSSLWLERITSVRQTLPASVELLDVNLASIEWRTLFHYGVSLNNLTYSSPELQRLRRKCSEKKMVQIKWNRTDLGFIRILDEVANTYMKVPCTWFDYANGMSLWLHKAIRNEALSHEGPESEAKLDAAKARLREKVEKIMSNKKLVTRKSAARAKNDLSTSDLAGPKKTPVQAYSPTVQTGENLTSFDADDNQYEDIPDFEILDRN